MILLPGFATTAAALTYFFLLLPSHPEMERRILEEIDQVIGRDRFPSLEDRPRMPYVESVMLEVLRILTQVPFTVPHTTMADVHISNYFLPANTHVSIYTTVTFSALKIHENDILCGSKNILNAELNFLIYCSIQPIICLNVSLLSIDVDWLCFFC